MKYAIIVSEKDTAGMNIKKQLAEYKLNPNISLHTIKDDSINAENIDKEIDADVLVFATKHKAKAGIKTLTCHTPGNFGKAEYGGRDGKLCIAYANLMKTAYLKLKENAKDTDYRVSLECTHHGPYLDKPCMFIEIGSTEEQWRDEAIGKVMAKTIIDILNSDIPNDAVGIGLGGPHYCDNFNKILERTGAALGHICPKYALEKLDETMLKQMFERSKEKPGFVILDWKGLGTEKQRIVDLLKKMNIKFSRTDKV